jgi:hypothetical protein
MSPALISRPANGIICNPHSKIRRLFQEVAARGGSLCSFGALTGPLGVGKARVAGLFGFGTESTGCRPTAKQVGALVHAFNQEGVPIQIDWLYQPLEIFDALLVTARGNAAPVAFWHQTVWHHARSHPALAFQIPERRGLRRPGAPAVPPPPQLRVGDRVRVALDPPAEIVSGAVSLHAVLIAETAGRPECLFPLVLGGTRILHSRLLLPDLAEDPFEVTGPGGVQHVYAVLTQFDPCVAVQVGLEDAELRVALDVLASRLAGQPRTQWSLYQVSAEVIAL